MSLRSPVPSVYRSLASFLIALPLAAMLSCSDKNQIPTEVKITIDEEMQFQRIQGFGGFGAQKVWWAEPPYFTTDFVDLLINDLGVTILRDNLPIAFEPDNDNADPYNIDWSGFNTSADHPGADSHMGEHLPYLKAMHDAGLEKLIVSVWSPPIWMKHNDHRGNGSDTIERRTSAPPYSHYPDENSNQLRVELYEEFAEYCVAYIRMLKRETGIDLYAISLQNEPRFSQFYASAVYDPAALRDLIKVVGARFELEDIETKIFMPEDVQSLEHVLGYITAVFDDPIANKYADIVAIHNYRGDGVNPSDSSPQRWKETAELALAQDKEIWMTETSGFDPASFDGGMALAKSIYNALEYGQVSAWIYWQMSGKDLIDATGEKTHLYYVSQHFYRHIRPGSIRVQADVNEDDLQALAFVHPGLDLKTLILINDQDNPVSISANGWPMMENTELFITSENQHFQKQAMDGFSEQTISLPAHSVSSLIWR